MKSSWVQSSVGIFKLTIAMATAMALAIPEAGHAASATQPAAATAAAKMMEYTVQAGDSCGTLAKRLYGDSHRVDLIHQNNELGPVPHKLRPGQILRVPVRATAAPQEPDARLTFVRNQVEAYTPDYHRGQKNEALAQGNRVGTLASSSAEIAFANETLMQLGEHSMVVIFGETPQSARHRRAAGAEDATLLKGTLRASLAELSGPAADPSRPPILVATPGAHVELPRQSGEVHIDVDAQSTTRLSVLRGRSRLAAAGQKVEVPSGFGSRADKGKAPTPPRPLPPAPIWAPAPPRLLLGKGAAFPVVVTYRAESGGGPPATAWHRQLARDAAFNDLLIDTKVAGDMLSWPLGELPEGELFVRVSAIDADRFEGQASTVLRTRVALLLQIPATKSAPAWVVFPRGLLCALDGAPLTTAEKAALTPAHDHRVRCALKKDPPPEEAAEVTIAAVDSGAVLAQILPGRTRWTDTQGERDITFRLTDSTGAPIPIPVTELQLSSAPNVKVAPLVAGAPGEYSTHLRWSSAVADLGLMVQLRGVQLAAIPLAPDPKESEPPPGDSIQLAPPRLQPITPIEPTPQGEPRVYFDLAAAGSALLNDGVYGFGGGGELGPRIRLPFGSLRIALRVLAEQALSPAQVPVMVNVGGVLTYVIGRPTWRVSPYLGFWGQAILQRTAGEVGSRAVRNNTGLVLGGLAGAQVRLWHGGIFAEVGYRHAVAQQIQVETPEWNTAFLLLGYRLSL